MSKLNFRIVDKKRECNRSPTQQYAPGKPLLKGAAARRDNSRFGGYCKRRKVGNAYRAVCGYRNYYAKFGLRLAGADLQKWQEHSKAVVKEKEEITEHHETKARKDCFAISVVGASESHGCETEITVVRNVTNPTFDCAERTMHLHSPFHSHHSHSHSSHGNGHYDWFFMSVWNIAGLNPYAVCIANHKAGKITLEQVKTKVSKSSGVNKVHSKNPNNSDSPVLAAVHSSFNKTKSGRDRMQKPMISVFEAFNRLELESMRKTEKQSIVATENAVRYSVHRNNPLLKEKPSTEMKAKTGVARTSIIKDPTDGTKFHGPWNGPLFHREPKTENLNPVNYPRLEIHAPRPVGYIPSRLPQKIKPKLVVGAEALPE